MSELPKEVSRRDAEATAGWTMVFQTRREFLKSASLGAAGLPFLPAQGPSQGFARKFRVCEIGHDGDYGHMAGAFAEFPNVAMAAVAPPT